MSIQKVYIETTIPSFYHSTRSDPESLARKNWTQHWWDFKKESYELFTSSAVLDELKKGDYPAKKEALNLMQGIPLLSIEPPIMEIVSVYLAHGVMPNDPVGDALHLAIASYHNCDFLLTWNCKHLANANKYRHIGRLNSMMRLGIPSLVTPLELIGQET
jgi:hypothetical protein